MATNKIKLLVVLILNITAVSSSSVLAQITAQSKTNILTASEKQEVAVVTTAAAKHLQVLQKQANAQVMGRLSASERNTRLACTLAYKGSLPEREGNNVGVVSFVSSDPANDPAILKLVTFPDWRHKGEYGFQHFDVAAWPVRQTAEKKTFTVRIEMRQGLYWDWADSHITDDSIGKDWWKAILASECK